jgi:hypothetical protein
MEKFYFIFSYWIFLWYLLYYFQFIQQYNPKFAIFLGLIQNFIILVLMIFYNTNSRLIFYFIIMVIILKIIPYYTIRNTKIYYRDIVATIILFIIYLCFMIFNDKNIYDFIKNTKNLILYNKNTLPGMVLLVKLGL